VPDRPETVANVGVQHPVGAAVGLDPDRVARLVSRPLGPKPIAGRQEVGLEDRFKDQLRRRHRYPVAHAWDRQRPGTARLSWLGDEDSPQRLRPVGPSPKLRGELLKEGRHPGRLHGVDGHPINARRPSVSTDLVPGPLEDVAAGDLVEQGMEATVRLLLGAAVQHTLQGTGRIQAIGSRGGPSPHAGTHRSSPSSMRVDEVGVLGPGGLCCPCRHRYYDPLRLPGGRPSLPVASVIGGPASQAPQARGHRGPLQFPRHPSDHSTPPTPEGSWAPAPGSLVPSMAFAPRNTGSAPSWSACAGIPNDAAGFA
jgi:hypothetical protein